MQIINTIQIIGAIISFITIIVVVRQKPSESQKILLLTCCCAFVSVLGYTLEINAGTKEAMLIGLKMGYVGKAFVQLFFFEFMMSFCRVPIPRKFVNFCLIYNTFLLVTILTCEKHELYYRNIHINYDGWFPVLAFDRSICYWMFMGGTVLLMGMYLVISIAEMARRSGKERSQIFLLSMGAFVPTVLLILYLAGFLNVFDPIPMGVVVSCALLTINVVKYGLLDTVELAKEHIFESTREGLIVIDEYNKLLYANHVARDLFPELDNLQKRNEQLRAIFNSDLSESIVEKDERNYEIRISEIKDDSRAENIRGYLAWIFDMSFISMYTEEMIRLRQEAEKANLAKSSFLARMSHEIRTPMNAILGFSDLCLRMRPEGRVSDYIENIRTSADTLLNLVNEVLDISKIESGKMELVEMDYFIKPLIQEVVSVTSQRATEKGLVFRYMVEEQVPMTFCGDKMRVREIMSNLLSNAVKYTEEGTILFKVKELERKDQRILLEIIVKDSGIGIKEEDMSKLFYKFERFDSRLNYSKEGSGLGLAIVKNLTELMDGSVEVDSVYGQGSTFRARIWQRISDDSVIGEYRGSNENQELEDKEVELHKLGAQFPGAQVLVVDDNEVNLKVAYGLLSLYGIEAEVVLSGKEALERAAQKRYDLVFMDQMMPELDGIETMRKMRETLSGYEEVPIVALTANALVGVREEMLKNGFDEFMGKPIEIHVLEQILQRFAGKYRVMVERESGSAVEEGQYKILIEAGIRAIEGEKFCGDNAGYVEVLGVFAGNARAQMEQLKQYIESGNAEQYTIMIHALKSSAKAIGAIELSEIAKEHEMMTKDGDLEFPKTHYEELKTIYIQNLEAIEQYLNAL